MTTRDRRVLAVPTGSVGRIAALAGALTFAQFAMFLAARGLVLDEHVNDLLHIADGAHRLWLGERPHIDYWSPLGILFFGAAPWAAGTPLDVASLVTALSVTWTLALLAAFGWLWWSRLGDGPTLLIAPAIALVGLAPRVLGFATESLTWAVPYNRWGMIALAIVMLFAAPRRNPDTRYDAVDAAVLGALMLGLFFLKVTFAFAAAAALFSIALVRTEARPAIFYAGLACVTILFVLEWRAGTISAYLANLAAVANSPLRTRSIVGRILAMLLENGANTIMAVVLLAAALLAPVTKAERALLAALVGIGVFAVTQNHGYFALPLVAPAILVARLHRSNVANADASGLSASLPMAALGASLMYFGATLLNQQWAMLTLLRASHMAPPATLTAPAETALGQAERSLARVMARDIQGTTNTCAAATTVNTREFLASTCRPAPSEYLATLKAAAKLVDQLQIPRTARVHTLDQINPIWWLTGRSPPRGIELWEFDVDAQKPLDAMHRFTDFVFLPAYSIEPTVGAELRARWQPALEKGATLVHSDALWQVWRVRPGPGQRFTMRHDCALGHPPAVTTYRFCP